MLEQFTTEDVISLAFSLSLLGSFLCFLKFLKDANLRAWSNICKDKAWAREKRGEKRGKRNILTVSFETTSYVPAVTPKLTSLFLGRVN